jgi:acetyl esterase/lipase
MDRAKTQRRQRQRTDDDDQQLQHASMVVAVAAKFNRNEFWRGSGRTDEKTGSPVKVTGLSRRAWEALSIVVAFACVGANELNMSSSAKVTGTAQKENDKRQAAYLRTDDRITDLLKHPAFAGFARLTLPWDDRDYDETMRLTDIGALLPYHSHVNPDVVVSALNRMIDDATVGKTVFYDIYTKAQKQAEPTRENTGLFFFRGKSGAPFAVIAPGGGFSYVGSVHEGFPYAVEISNRGYNAFVLKYRAGHGGTVATQDLAAAVSYILRNAHALHVSATEYSLWGSSAGARMAAAIGSHGTTRFGAPELPKPSAIVMAYTGHSELGSSDPATFVVVGERDGIALPAIMERRVALLRRAGTEVEYHKYAGLGHGFGLGAGTSADGWVTDAVRFWEKQIRRASVTPRRSGDNPGE